MLRGCSVGSIQAGGVFLFSPRKTGALLKRKTEEREGMRQRERGNVVEEGPRKGGRGMDENMRGGGGLGWEGAFPLAQE